MKLVIATGNSGKIRDFQSVFDGAELDVKVLSINEFGGMPDVDETEPDFKGNAKLKAQAAKSILEKDPELWVLSDDSGLSVEFLKGGPGVHSARYAGDNATDEDNRDKLIRALNGVEEDNRNAAFVCHLCLISPQGEELHFEGRCEGKIAFESKGTKGFGYDPLFIPTGSIYTWGEQSLGKKNEDSHRGKACQQMLQWMQGRLFS